MSCNNCSTNPCCCQSQPPACNCPPSPIPPWARPTQNPRVQTLVDNTVPLVLDPDVAYLNQVGGGPNAMVMPNGNFLKQMMRIYVLSGTIATTATWVFTGLFAGGFTHLTFNTTKYSALLEWDGAAWQLVGGNAGLT